MKEKILHFIDKNPFCKIGDLCAFYDGKKNELMNTLSLLENEGDIIKQNNAYVLPYQLGLLKATIVSIKPHFAFALVEGESEDVHLDEEDMMNAMLGDIVYLRFEKNVFKVVDIIKRKHTQVVGEVNIYKNEVLLDVSSLACSNIAFNVLEADVCQHDIVQAEIVSYDHYICNVKVIKVLGQKNAPFMDVTRLILENDAPIEFPSEVDAEVLDIPQEVLKEEYKGRVDLRDELIVTIDGEDARDFDDAVSIKKFDDSYELGVHIADVSHYVKEDSYLDKEAFNRGCSLYVTDRVVPMLPFSLSNGICSLNEGVDRLTISCIVKLDLEGNIINSKIVPSIIKSSHRLTYTYVNQVIKENNPSNELENTIMLFEELSLLLRAKKKERGEINLDVPEIKIHVNEIGFPISIEKKVQGEGEKLIEDFMILANEVVATTITSKHVPFIYRIHENPEAKRLTNFISFASRLGYKANFSPLSPTPLEIAKFLDGIEDDEKRNVISSTLLRSLAKARYASSNKGHFGLASTCYTHFTSPIRRYPDLIVHRLIKKYIFNNDFSDLNAVQGDLDFISENTSIKERRAITIERDCNDMKGAEYMEQFIGQTFTGYINGISNFGLFFELENGLDGCIRFEDMDDYFFVNEQQYIAIGRRTNKRYAIGDKVTATLVKTDKYSGTSSFVINNDNSKSRYLINKYDRAKHFLNTRHKRR